MLGGRLLRVAQLHRHQASDEQGGAHDTHGGQLFAKHSDADDKRADGSDACPDV
jgi:hypothetical protein